MEKAMGKQQHIRRRSTASIAIPRPTILMLAGEKSEEKSEENSLEDDSSKKKPVYSSRSASVGLPCLCMQTSMRS